MGAVIHIIDDDESFRIATGRLVGVLGFQPLLYQSGDQFLEQRPKVGPGCILLDLRLPGLSGPDLQSRINAEVPLLPIIYLTGQGDIPSSVRAIKAGAEDFLVKPVSRVELSEVIDRALLEYVRRRREYDRLELLRALLARLTPRELEVFGLMVRGQRNKQIAYAISTSERTVKAHRHCVMEKLGARSLAEAVSMAEKLGFTQME